MMLAEVAQHAGLLKDYWSTLKDPAHLMTELTVELATAVPGLIYARVWVRRHDAKEHPHD